MSLHSESYTYMSLHTCHYSHNHIQVQSESVTSMTMTFEDSINVRMNNAMATYVRVSGKIKFSLKNVYFPLNHKTRSKISIFA